MKLYKDKDGSIFAYEEDGSQDHLIGDKTPATQEDVDAINKARNDAIEAEIAAAAILKQAAISKLMSLGLTEEEALALGTK